MVPLIVALSCDVTETVQCKREAILVLDRRAQHWTSLCYQSMDENFVLISRENITTMITMMKRARGYCLNAQPTSLTDFNDVTGSYPGANGYAGATLGQVIDNLEAHLD